MRDWKMQDWKMQNHVYLVNWIEKKQNKNKLSIIVLYYLMLQCIHYFVTAVVPFAFNYSTY